MAYEEPSNQQKLKDLHWRLASGEGVEFSARYLLSEVKFPNAWGDSFPFLTILNGIERRNAALQESVDKLTEMVAQLSLAQGVTIDYNAIAKKVNDDAAARMAK